MTFAGRAASSVAVLVFAVAASSCAGREAAPPSAAPSEAGATATPTVIPTAGTTDSSTDSAEQATTPDPTHSLAAVADRPPRGGQIRVIGGDERRQEMTYRSDDVRVSGLLLRPAGKEPFPAVIIAHGRVPRDTYRTGDGFRAEQRALVAAGFVVLQTDYRGHAGSDGLAPLEENTLVGYTRDVINAIATVRDLPEVDPGRVGLIGRSMGGGIIMNVLVTHPELARAAVLLSPTSSTYAETEALLAPTATGGGGQDVGLTFGTPTENPRFYRDLSPAHLFEHITASVQIQHGTADQICPIAWSERSLARMRAAGVQASAQRYAGEGHVFSQLRDRSVREAITFLDAELQ